MTLLEMLTQRANAAVSEHTRLVLIVVLHTLQHAESKESAMQQIQEAINRS